MNTNLIEHQISNSNLSLHIINLLKTCGIFDVTSDSKEAKKGVAFVAIRGALFDGNHFIESAVIQGSNLIFTDNIDIYSMYKDKMHIELVDNSRKILAALSCYLYYKSPNRLFAVTGTNGKSSVVHYLGQFLSLLGLNSASIGTIGVLLYKQNGDIDVLRESGLTTENAVLFNKELWQLKENGIEYCAIEASSIGIDQYRLYGRVYEVAGFTSFSVDHLDYHKNMDEYLAVKLRLFSEYQNEDSIAVINSDMDEFPHISGFLRKVGRKILTIGENGDFKIEMQESAYEGQRFCLSYDSKKYDVETSIIGRFQVYNIVMAIAMLSCIDIKLDCLVDLVHKLSAPLGRLERVSESGKGASIYVDYSHTPDSLEKALQELRHSADKGQGKLIVIFGCGGDRDATKRPLMGGIASKYADLVIVTDDNPRSEYPSDIRKQIMVGCKNAVEISSRKEAIAYGINNMQTGDLILIAGKGHENYQIYRNKIIEFSDKKVTKDLLSGLI